MSGTALLAGIGWFAAPLLGAALASGAGLSGAAATAHGLALLGGGSLAVGGSGMAGGTWLVTTTAATVGFITSGGGNLLLQLGSASAQIELLKLQVSYKEIMLAGQMDRAKAKETIRKLEKDRDKIRSTLDEERALNDSNSARLKDIEATLQAIEDSLNWMDKQAA